MSRTLQSPYLFSVCVTDLLLNSGFVVVLARKLADLVRTSDDKRLLLLELLNLLLGIDLALPLLVEPKKCTHLYRDMQRHVASDDLGTTASFNLVD